MAGKNRYSTKQGELILACLKDLKEQHVTVEQIMDHLRGKGKSVGQTTIYRNLDKLVRYGSVIKYAGAEGMGACYQYAAHPDGGSMHYHLICEECDQITHLECTYLDEMTAHLQGHHGFDMNRFKTVIYGVCKACAAKKRQICPRE